MNSNLLKAKIALHNFKSKTLIWDSLRREQKEFNKLITYTSKNLSKEIKRGLKNGIDAKYNNKNYIGAILRDSNAFYFIVKQFNCDFLAFHISYKNYESNACYGYNLVDIKKSDIVSKEDFARFLLSLNEELIDIVLSGEYEKYSSHEEFVNSKYDLKECIIKACSKTEQSARNIHEQLPFYVSVSLLRAKLKELIKEGAIETVGERAGTCFRVKAKV